MEPKKEKEYKNIDGKAVGVLRDGIYHSQRKGSKHLMRAMDAWGVDATIMDDLIVNECQEMQVVDNEDGTVYSVSMDVLNEKGIRRAFGHGPQIFLPRRYWTITRP